MDQVSWIYYNIIKSGFFKKLFSGAVLIFITFYIKDSSISSYVLDLFNLNNTESNLYFVSGFLALIFRLIFKGILDLFLEVDGEYAMLGNNTEDSLKEKRPLNLNKNSDSGNEKISSSSCNDAISPSNNIPSASGSSSAEASSSKAKPSWEPVDGKGVITDSDYEWESDHSNGGIGHGYSSDDSISGKESDVSKFINSIDFEDRVKRANLDELSEALNTIDQAKSLYENSTVPSKHEQLALLEKKEALCLAEIEQKLIEMENSVEKVEDKGKGKEIDNSGEKVQDKGKGKYIEK